MKKMKRWVSFLLVLCLTLGSFTGVYAAEISTKEEIPERKEAGIEGKESGRITSEWVENPLYPKLPETKSPVPNGGASAPVKERQFLTSTTQGGLYLRPYLVQRAATMNLSFRIRYLSDLSDVIGEMLDIAMEHTGVSYEGDYIRWHWKRWYTDTWYSYNYYTGVYSIDLDLHFEYYTNKAQEQEMTAATAKLVNSLGLKGNSKNDYQKIKTAYDYITSNVTYDHAHVNDTVYGLQQSAYAALLHKTSVCQGYATLMYRLMLEAGVDCRVITSDDHAWNIVKLGKYYNIDATWDAGETTYHYFLLNDRNFTDSYSHVREYPWNTVSFYNQYPMGSENYVPSQSECLHKWDNGTVTAEPGCVSTGTKTFICQICGGSRTETIAAKGHVEEKIEGYDATCTEKGLTEGKKCSVCAQILVEQKEILAKGHDYQNGICSRCQEKSPDYVERPAAPVLTKASNETNGIKLTWKKVNGATNYKVYRNGKYLATVGAQATSYLDKKVSGGKKYTYTLTVTTKGGTSVRSKALTYLYLKKPTISSIKKSGQNLKITWKKAAGATKYEIWRKANNGKWSKIGTTKSLSYVDKYNDSSKLKKNNKYTYLIRAVNGKYTSCYDKKGKTYSYK